MKRPMLPVALWFSAGILAAHFVEISLPALFTLAFACGFLSLCWPQARAVLLGALVFFTGWVNLTCRTSVLSPHDLRALLNEQPALVTLRGTLCGAPSQRVVEREGEELWHTLAPVEVNAIRIGQRPWQPARGTVQTSTKGNSLTNLFSGQPVEVNGVLAPPPGPLAEGLFDYRAYLAGAGIYYQLKVGAEEDWQAVGPLQLPPWTERFRLWAQKTLARGLPETDEVLKLQWAMVLGWKTALTGEVSAPFMRSGTMHIFAISGLHIALIAGILLALFRLFNLPRGLCGAVVIPLIWFYTAATEWQASAIRSTVMMTIIIAGWSLRRPCDLLNSLAGAAFVILLWDPQQVFQASFQLSFGAVASLALILPPLDNIRRSWLQTDPWLPDQLRPRWQRALLWGANHFTQALATSLAASVGTLPLIAYYFHLFTPCSLLANVVVVPLSSLALMSGLGGVICGDWLPWATELFNHSGWFFMLCMVRASAWFAHWPGAYAYVSAPGLLTLIAFYIVLLAALGGGFAPRFRWWTTVGIGAFAAVWVGAWLQRGAITRITILPLSGGHAVWVDAPGRRNDWLIDCGNGLEAERVTTPFLHGQGVNTLPSLVLTHGDVRHVGGSTNLAHNFAIDGIGAGPVWFRSPSYRHFIQTWTNSHRRITEMRAGDRLDGWTVLHPSAGDRFAQADDNAVVLRRDGGPDAPSVLLCSDLGPLGQNALLARRTDLRAEIVISGLPTKGEPLHDALLDAIQPRFIVIADADYPASERASPKLKMRLRRRGVMVLYLRESNAVTLEFKKQRWSIHCMSGGEGQDRSLDFHTICTGAAASVSL